MAFGTGLSGLNASAKNLDVIGHNIANANTTGMKGSRAEFGEMYASALGATGGNSGGMGVALNTVAQQFVQGNITITGNSMDMAINGAGLFKVKMTDGSTAFTRAGDFKLDKLGYITTNAGGKIQGYDLDEVTGNRTSAVTGDLQLPTGGVIAPKITSTITLKANLDSKTDEQVPATPYGAGTLASPALAAEHKTYGTAINVFDTQGNAIPVEIYFVKNAVANQWDVHYSLDGGITTLTSTATPPTVTFDASGNPIPPAAPATTMPGLIIPVGAVSTNPQIPASAIGTAAVPAVVDVGDAVTGWNLTQFNTKFGVYDIKQDGYTAGQLTDMSVGEDGKIAANFSNGETQYIGQVTLVNFTNLQGLGAVNGGYWVETAASGQPIESAPMDGNMGSIRSQALEESTVDITAELVNMIVAQRSYQANAQTIKTQDQVLSTLVNLR